MLWFREIESFEDFEYVRNLYNASLADLATKPLEPSTLEDQITWYFRAQPEVMIGMNHEYRPVGFFALTPRVYGDFHTPIFVIHPDHRGKGYARHFIQGYISHASTPLAGSQLKSNKVICRLNEEIGWQIVAERDGVQYLYHPGGTQMAQTNARRYAMREAEHEL